MKRKKSSSEHSELISKSELREMVLACVTEQPGRNAQHYADECRQEAQRVYQILKSLLLAGLVSRHWERWNPVKVN